MPPPLLSCFFPQRPGSGETGCSAEDPSVSVVGLGRAAGWLRGHRDPAPHFRCAFAGCRPRAGGGVVPPPGSAALWLGHREPWASCFCLCLAFVLPEHWLLSGGNGEFWWSRDGRRGGQLREASGMVPALKCRQGREGWVPGAAVCRVCAGSWSLPSGSGAQLAAC